MVLMFSAAKEAYEDVQRHKSDEETNLQKVRRFGGYLFEGERKKPFTR